MSSMNKKLLTAINSGKHLINETNLGLTTKRDYKRILEHSIKTLHQKGFVISDVKQLKQKHIRCLVDDWTLDK